MENGLKRAIFSDKTSSAPFTLRGSVICIGPLYSLMADPDFYGYAHKATLGVITGDDDPTDFSFNMVISDEDLLKLYKRNEYVQIKVEWLPGEALRQWLTFKSEKDLEKLQDPLDPNPPEIKGDPVSGTKFGKPFEFEDFQEYLSWINAQEKINIAMSWAELFGHSIAVFLDSDVGKKSPKGNVITLNKNTTGVYDNFDVYHPLMPTSDGDNGYSLISKKIDDMGKPTQYKIKIFTKGMEKSKTILVDADRVVPFFSKKKEIRYGGNSSVEGIAIVALAEEQTFRRLMKRAHDVAGGMLKITGVQSKEEADGLHEAIGEDLSSIDQLMVLPARDVDYITPDLKASGEFRVIFDIFGEKLSRFTRVSKQQMDGAPEGTISSAKYNTFTSYTPIYQLQAHYHTTLEWVFHKLGLDDTRFEWNEILPDEMENLPQLGIKHSFGDDKPPIDKENDQDEPTKKTTNKKEKPKRK